MSTRPGPVSIPWLIFAGTCSPFGFNVVPVLLPAIQAEFALEPGRMQWMVSLYSLTLGLGQLLGGPLSDTLGRRRVLIAGLVIFIAGSIGAVCAATYDQLLAYRLLQGLGACATLVIPRATVRDCFDGPDAARAIALITFSLAMTPVVAPLIGGALEAGFGWRSGFAACAVLGGAVFAFAWRMHGETLPPSRRQRLHLASLFRGYAALFASWRFGAYAFSYSLLNCSFIGFMVVGPPYLAHTYGLSTVGIALAMIAGCLGFLAGNLLAARRVRRVGVERLLAWGAAVGGTGTALMIAVAYHPVLGWLVAAIFIQSLGTGFAFAAGIAGAIATLPERAGTAAAMTGAIQLGSSALFAAFSGYIDDGSFKPFAWSCLVLCVAAALLIWPLWHGRAPLAAR